MKNLLPRFSLTLLVLSITLFIQWPTWRNQPRFQSLPTILSFSDTFKLSFIDHLGGEYDCIAQALYHGKGFSNPFCYDSGPTAWTSPAFPAFLASLYWFSHGDRRVVSLMYSTVGSLFLLVIGFFLLRKAEMAQGARGAWLMFLIYALFLIANIYRLFQLTHDIPFVAIGLLGLYCFVQKVNGTDLQGKSLFIWGIVCGFLPLVNSIFLIVWLSLHLWLLFEGAKFTNRYRFFSRWVLALFLFSLPTLWLVDHRFAMSHYFLDR